MTILLLEVPELILLLVSSRPLHIRKTLPQVHKNIESIGIGSSQIKKKQKTRRERSYCQTYWNITVPGLGISVLSYIGSLLPISFFLFLTVSISSWLSFSLSFSSSVIFPLYCSPHFLVLFLRLELFAMQQCFSLAF